MVVVRRVTRDADDAFVLALAGDCDQRHGAVMVHVDELLYLRLARIAQRVHEALVARLRAQSIDELALALRIVRADRADPVGECPHYRAVAWLRSSIMRISSATDCAFI